MTHADLINLWPSLSEFAADIGVEYGTAKAMRRRSSVPSDKWVVMVASAKQREIEGVTYEALAVAAADADRQTDTAARDAVEQTGEAA